MISLIPLGLRSVPLLLLGFPQWVAFGAAIVTWFSPNRLRSVLLLLLGFVQWVAFGAARRHRLISPSQPLNFLSPIYII